ncbi:hypothetical protein D9M68_760920 [compost metagenome]
MGQTLKLPQTVRTGPQPAVDAKRGNAQAFGLSMFIKAGRQFVTGVVQQTQPRGLAELRHGMLSATFGIGAAHRRRTRQVLRDRITPLGEQQGIPLISGMALDSTDNDQMVPTLNELFASTFKSRNAIAQQW